MTEKNYPYATWIWKVIENSEGLGGPSNFKECMISKRLGVHTKKCSVSWQIFPETAHFMHISG